jgi:hypothetical protein
MPVKRFFKALVGKKHSHAAKCSFCGKYHSEVAKLIAGPDCYICNECVLVCSDLLVKECGEDLKSLRDKAVAIRREAIADELRWLAEQSQQGQLSEVVYLERQRDLIRPWRKTEPGPSPNGDPATERANSGVSEGRPSVSR